MLGCFWRFFWYLSWEVPCPFINLLIINLMCLDLFSTQLLISYLCLSILHDPLLQTTFICHRRGGSSNKSLPHYEWCHTVHFEPDLISISFIPITSLLNGIHGSGFLSHAINLYLRCEYRIHPHPTSVLIVFIKYCWRWSLEPQECIVMYWSSCLVRPNIW